MDMTFSDKIKNLRAERGLTLEQVATVVGVGKSTVRKWETGDIKNMRRDKIYKLSVALGVSPAWLMGWSDEAEKTATDDGSDFRTTPEEQHLVELYRVAAPDDKSIVMLTLKKYEKNPARSSGEAM